MPTTLCDAHKWLWNPPISCYAHHSMSAPTNCLQCSMLTLTLTTHLQHQPLISTTFAIRHWQCRRLCLMAPAPRTWLRRPLTLAPTCCLRCPLTLAPTRRLRCSFLASSAHHSTPAICSSNILVVAAKIVVFDGTSTQYSAMMPTIQLRSPPLASTISTRLRCPITPL